VRVGGGGGGGISMLRAKSGGSELPVRFEITSDVLEG
jgi:hypothetical protein